ncbi:hypothetical protein EV361DRAFT_967997 [Lentinula raphanica]|uniref:TPR-like protein n=1 Tax=Lentinula raphanica TaxID=153919 RepID=A0AA38PLB4_9AGAR|nr:hypothetical protein F5878DRAFT_648544 [Lentinula raphanica]KAJ3977747.1 hypothetical protein EV361DRAFT_967997 [Lentinula raphanica]
MCPPGPNHWQSEFFKHVPSCKKMKIMQLCKPWSRNQSGLSQAHWLSPTGIEGFAQGPIFVLNVLKRFLKFSLIGGVSLGLVTGLIFEGTHIWVENVEFAVPQDDEETLKWEWDLERENWSGDLRAAGTDPVLGLRGRHLVRAAWMAQHWGVDQSTVVVSSDALRSEDGLLGPRGLVIIDPRLIRAENFLRDAIHVAEQKSIEGTLRPWTMTHLLTLHASVLERMGSESMITAKGQYERAWSSQPFIAPQSARIAAKLGDLHRRLGDNDGAVAWWTRAIHVAQPQALESSVVPSLMPQSPYNQRSLLFALSSLSAFYATTGDFTQAQSIAEASLSLVRSVRQPESITSISVPHALHALTLLQRSSVLAIHLAEVLYAQKNPIVVSTQWLSTAAESSERVIRALTGLPLNVNTVPDRALVSPANDIHLSYLNNASLRKPANSLYRDSRRTVAEAWNLTGILLESKDPKAALAAYENAIRFAGNSDEHGKPSDKTLKVDWEVIWGNYTRLKSKLETQ